MPNPQKSSLSPLFPPFVPFVLCSLCSPFVPLFLGYYMNDVAYSSGITIQDPRLVATLCVFYDKRIEANVLSGAAKTLPHPSRYIEFRWL